MKLNTMSDDDGSMDVIAYDYNQDGEWDKFEGNKLDLKLSIYSHFNFHNFIF